MHFASDARAPPPNGDDYASEHESKPAVPAHSFRTARDGQVHSGPALDERDPHAPAHRTVPAVRVLALEVYPADVRQPEDPELTGQEPGRLRHEQSQLRVAEHRG